MTLPLVKPELNYEPASRFWEGIQDEELRLPHCSSCQRYHWYPKPICPHCQSDSLIWRPISGNSTLYTWVGVQYEFLPFLSDEIPLDTGLVVPKEDDSIRLVGLLDMPDDRDPEIGMKLAVEFIETDEDIKMPIFRPA